MEFYENGQNQIEAWLLTLPASERPKVKSKMNNIVDNQKQLPVFNPKVIKPLRHLEGSLLEMRFLIGKVQYRPILVRGPGAGVATILVGAKEVSWEFDPISAPATALQRKGQMAEPERVKDYDYNKRTSLRKS